MCTSCCSGLQCTVSEDQSTVSQVDFSLKVFKSAEVRKIFLVSIQDGSKTILDWFSFEYGTELNFHQLFHDPRLITMLDLHRGKQVPPVKCSESLLNAPNSSYAVEVALTLNIFFC